MNLAAAHSRSDLQAPVRLPLGYDRPTEVLPDELAPKTSPRCNSAQCLHSTPGHPRLTDLATSSRGAPHTHTRAFLSSKLSKDTELLTGLMTRLAGGLRPLCHTHTLSRTPQAAKTLMRVTRAQPARESSMFSMMSRRSANDGRTRELGRRPRQDMHLEADLTRTHRSVGSLLRPSPRALIRVFVPHGACP